MSMDTCNDDDLLTNQITNTCTTQKLMIYFHCGIAICFLKQGECLSESVLAQNMKSAICMLFNPGHIHLQRYCKCNKRL